jgi:hypothetical protein
VLNLCRSAKARKRFGLDLYTDGNDHKHLSAKIEDKEANDAGGLQGFVSDFPLSLSFHYTNTESTLCFVSLTNRFESRKLRCAKL